MVRESDGVGVGVGVESLAIQRDTFSNTGQIFAHPSIHPSVGRSVIGMTVHDPSMSQWGARVRDSSTGQHSSIGSDRIDRSINGENPPNQSGESATRTPHANGDSVDAKHGGERSATRAIERRWWDVDDDDVGETKSARWWGRCV